MSPLSVHKTLIDGREANVEGDLIGPIHGGRHVKINGQQHYVCGDLTPTPHGVSRKILVDGFCAWVGSI